VPDDEFAFLECSFGQRHAAKTRQSYIATLSIAQEHPADDRGCAYADRPEDEMDGCRRHGEMSESKAGWGINYFEHGPATKDYRFLDR